MLDRKQIYYSADYKPDRIKWRSSKIATKVELRPKKAYLVWKTDFENKLSSFDKIIKSNKTKKLICRKWIKKLTTFDSRLFIGQKYFNNDEAQLYLIFQPVKKTITTFSGLPDIISELES